LSTKPDFKILAWQFSKNKTQLWYMSKTTAIEFQNLVYDPNKPRAVVDYMKWMSTIEIKQDLESRKQSFSILLVNIDYDNNSGNIIRTANALGATQVILYRRRNFDRRSSMGTEFYMDFQLIKYAEDIDSVLAEFDIIVGLENGIKAKNLVNYKWNKGLKTLICIGQESTGLPQAILDKCHDLVEIPQVGSVRSLNVGTAAGIAMYDYCTKTRLPK
jgi:tRNA G18 (ribose-2'-O)-methylase SpoU